MNSFFFSMIVIFSLNTSEINHQNIKSLTQFKSFAKNYDCLITGTGVRMRSQPSVSGAVIGYFEDGEYIREIEWNSDWCKVERKNGDIGWVSGKYVYCPDNVGCSISGTGVRMRSIASTSGKIVDYFTDGEYVSLLTNSPDGFWCLVRKENGQTGWVHGDYLSCGDY